MEQLYAGIDLHSSNNYIGVINEKDERLYSKSHSNQLGVILNVLEPFKKNLQGVVVESTYNWYWLVDGLMDHGYKVHLANPSAIKQYEGLKHTDDKWDSFWLAHMKRLNILPEGYIYPKEERPVRDLLRRRTMFVRHRTSQMLSLQSAVTRNLGINISSNEIKKLKEPDAEQLFDSPCLKFTAESNIATIRFLSQRIRLIEKEVMLKIKLRPEFEILLTIPGIGKILGLTIMLEVGDIGRFPEVGNYSSYCRSVRSIKITNNKKKGEGNRKNGNRHLAWAYVEGAHFATRTCEKAQRFYQQKLSQRNEAVASKALANKLSKASYYIMRDQVPFDENMLFR